MIGKSIGKIIGKDIIRYVGKVRRGAVASITEIDKSFATTGVLMTSAEVDAFINSLIVGGVPVYEGQVLYNVTINLLGNEPPTAASAASIAIITGSPYFNEIDVENVDPIAPVATSDVVYNASTDNLVCDKPTGTVEGDTMFAYVNLNTQSQAINTPAGWTLEITELVRPNVSNSVYVFSKKAGASEPANYTFDGWVTDRCAMAISSYRNVPTSPIDTYSVNTTPGFTATGSSITTTAPNELLIYILFNDAGGTFVVSTPPAGMTLRLAATTAAGILIYDEAITAAGETGDRVAETSGYYLEKKVLMIALKNG